MVDGISQRGAEHLYAIADRKVIPEAGEPEVIFCMDEFGPLSSHVRVGGFLGGVFEGVLLGSAEGEARGELGAVGADPVTVLKTEHAVADQLPERVIAEFAYQHRARSSRVADARRSHTKESVGRRLSQLCVTAPQFR
ncbi:hypothetical protein ABZ375_05860 [Streptomyces tibetensis]